MSEFLDLLTGTQDAVYTTLAAAIAPDMAEVEISLPEVTEDSPMPPRLIILGDIDIENQGGKGEQLERAIVEVQSLYRGSDRRQVLAMMHAARVTLDDRLLSIDGVQFRCTWLNASSGRAADGVTFAGISNFEIYAEPA